MNSASEGRPSDREEDSWEALAENLFGIDFAKSDDAEESPLADDLLNELIEEPAPVLEDPRDSVSTSDESPEDVATNNLYEALEEVPSAEGETEEAAAKKAEHDPYWDVLKDWEWDESVESTSDRPSALRPDRSRPPKEHRKPDVIVPSAEAEGIEDLRAQYLEDAEFGLGVLEDDASAAPPTSRRARSAEPEVARDEGDTFGEQPPTGEEGERPRRRRRRRGRGGKPGGEREPRIERVHVERESETSDEEVEPVGELDFGDIQDDFDSEEPISEAREGEPAASDRDPERKRRRRRGGRRRRRPDGSEPTSREAAPREPREREEVESSREGERRKVDLHDEDEAWEPEAEDEESPEALARAAERYRNAPTWEEAISYLLKPKEARRHPSESSGESRPAGETSEAGGEQSRPPRRRRHRR